MSDEVKIYVKVELVGGPLDGAEQSLLVGATVIVLHRERAECLGEYRLRPSNPKRMDWFPNRQKP